MWYRCGGAAVALELKFARVVRQVSTNHIQQILSSSPMAFISAPTVGQWRSTVSSDRQSMGDKNLAMLLLARRQAVIA